MASTLARSGGSVALRKLMLFVQNFAIAVGQPGSGLDQRDDDAQYRVSDLRRTVRT